MTFLGPLLIVGMTFFIAYLSSVNKGEVKTIGVHDRASVFINDFKNATELKEGINSYMDKYNNQRFHSSIGYQKPMNVYRDYLQNAA